MPRIDAAFRPVKIDTLDGFWNTCSQTDRVAFITRFVFRREVCDQPK